MMEQQVSQYRKAQAERCFLSKLAQNVPDYEEEVEVVTSVNVFKKDCTAPLSISMIVRDDPTRLPIPPQTKGRKKKQAEERFEDKNPEARRLSIVGAYQCAACWGTPLHRHEYMLRASVDCPPDHAICTDCYLEYMQPKTHRCPKTREDQLVLLRCPKDDRAFNPLRVIGEKIPDEIKLMIREKKDKRRSDRIFKRDLERSRAEAKRGTMLQCGICMQKFKNYSQKKAHKRKVHRGIVDKCLDCKRVFSCKQKLQSHRDNGCKILISKLFKAGEKAKMKQRRSFHCRFGCLHNCNGKIVSEMGFLTKEERNYHEFLGNCAPKRVVALTLVRCDL